MSSAVITGGAGGLGRAIAHALWGENDTGGRRHQIVLVDIDEHGLEAAQRELEDAYGPRAVMCFVNDVSSAEDVARVADEVVAAAGEIDVLVNNAAVTDRRGRIEELSDDDWHSELAVNLSSAFFWTRAVFGGMRQRGWGRIVNVSSVAGMLGNYGHAPYSTSKAGMIGLTKTAALEGARSGVTVNAVAPGIIRTPAYDRIEPGLRARTEATAAMRRAAEPAEVAAVVAFLTTQAVSYMTGAVVPVTGGTDLFVM